MIEQIKDVVIDTDAYNEIDDQFAIAYALRSKKELNVKAIYAAPFLNAKVKTACEGMEKSYEEIERLLLLAKADIKVYKGSRKYLPDENTPVISDTAKDLAERAKKYSPKRPLYVVAIGAITNIASAILLAPEIVYNIVVVWLGGHARHYSDTKEFNMIQDVAAARVVMRKCVNFVQLPCVGVVDVFRVSCAELEKFYLGKNELSDYLAKNVIEEVRAFRLDNMWSRVIWDVTAVAYLLNFNDKFMKSRAEKVILPNYDGFYDEETGGTMTYVYHIERDELFEDLSKKITE